MSKETESAVCEDCESGDHTTQQHRESVAVQEVMKHAEYMGDDELDAALDEITDEFTDEKTD